MPWFVWMCFLTAPVLVGVACTLASDAPNDPKGAETVFLAGGVWLFVAYHLRHHLEERTPARWVRWWVSLCVVVPLVSLFVASLRHDAGVMRLVEARQREGEKPAADGAAAAAPVRRAFTWAESKQLVARVRPLAADFAMKLFTSMPPAWWFVAFGVGLWRGK
jgi:hypothetical protein